jgi:hypothetical protein
MTPGDWKRRCSEKTKRQCLALPNRLWKGVGLTCAVAGVSGICKTPRELKCNKYGDMEKVTVITIWTYEDSCKGVRPIASKWITNTGAAWGFYDVAGRVQRNKIGKWICAGSSRSNTGFPGQIKNIKLNVLYKDIPASYCENVLKPNLGGNNKIARDGDFNYKTYKYCAVKSLFATDNAYVNSCSARPIAGRETEGGGNCGGRCGGRQAWEGCCHCPKSSGGT